jgi:phage-related protein
MSTVGPGVREIRSHIESEHRVIYVAKFRRAVYVLHGFEKKSQKTRRTLLEVARTRYR